MQILSCKLTVKQEFIGEIWLGRALTKTFIHIPFVGTVMLEHHCANKRKKHKKHKVADGWSHLFVFFFVFVKALPNIIPNTL